MHDVAVAEGWLLKMRWLKKRVCNISAIIVVVLETDLLRRDAVSMKLVIGGNVTS